MWQAVVDLTRRLAPRIGPRGIIVKLSFAALRAPQLQDRCRRGGCGERTHVTQGIGSAHLCIPVRILI
jgi:hypothetical protein